jgi:3-phosphoshikimate 1-carboxyvinyltransferase
MNRKISPVTRLNGSIETPPDKSIAQRAALFSLLSTEESVIRNYPSAADPQSALRCIQALGADIRESDGVLIIRGPGRKGLPLEAGTVDCGNSGTTMRLLAGILAGSGTGATLTGDASLSRRTMKRIIEPLKAMGAEINARDNDYAPLEIMPGNVLRGITYPLPVASAQLKSCILLAGLFTDGTTVVEKVPSRNHTESMLGLRTQVENHGINIHSSRETIIPAMSLTIPGDFSSAAFWLVAGAIYPHSGIRILKCGLNPTRTAALSILRRMGAKIEISNEVKGSIEPMADLTAESSVLKPVRIEADEIPNCIDEIPVLAVAMAFANGISEFRGAEELRHKECDRIYAVARMLESTGVELVEYDDGLRITGNPGLVPRAGTFETHHDHRIAMAAAILAGRSDGTSIILNAEAASVSYADFWEHFDKLSQRG